MRGGSVEELWRSCGGVDGKYDVRITKDDVNMVPHGGEVGLCGLALWLFCFPNVAYFMISTLRLIRLADVRNSLLPGFCMLVLRLSLSDVASGDCRKAS